MFVKEALTHTTLWRQVHICISVHMQSTGPSLHCELQTPGWWREMLDLRFYSGITMLHVPWSLRHKWFTGALPRSRSWGYWRICRNMGKAAFGRRRGWRCTLWRASCACARTWRRLGPQVPTLGRAHSRCHRRDGWMHPELGGGTHQANLTPGWS